MSNIIRTTTDEIRWEIRTMNLRKCERDRARHNNHILVMLYFISNNCLPDVWPNSVFILPVVYSLLAVVPIMPAVDSPSHVVWSVVVEGVVVVAAVVGGKIVVFSVNWEVVVMVVAGEVVATEVITLFAIISVVGS